MSLPKAQQSDTEIDIANAEQLNELSAAWGASPFRIRQAVRSVGPVIADVRRWLEDPTNHANNIGRRWRRRWRDG